KGKKIILIGAAVILLILIVKIGYFFYQENIRWNGRSFENRSKMCFQFAVDYLNNIKNDPNYTDEKRELAIDIETEITNLCQLDLTTEAVKSYKPKALEKYQQE